VIGEFAMAKSIGQISIEWICTSRQSSSARGGLPRSWESIRPIAHLLWRHGADQCTPRAACSVHGAIANHSI